MDYPFTYMYPKLNPLRRLPMEYLDQGRRESLIRAKNDLGETPLHLTVSFAGGSAGAAGAAGGAGGSGEASEEGGRGSGSGSRRRGGVSKREADFAVQVRYDPTRAS